MVDLRLKFAMSKTERTVDTCIIVMELGLGEEQATVGALADSIEEVIDLDPGDIDPPPRLGTQISTDLISGIGKKEGHFIIILDIKEVFTLEELAETVASTETISENAPSDS